MTKLFALTAALLVFALPVQAQSTLLELFASNNCRSCPKAHDTMRSVVAARADVLVVTWSVDYWDYLGEADPMAIEESRARQEAYVEKFALRGPYTPQTVYNGNYHCPGNRPRDVSKALAEVAADAPGFSRIEATPTGYDVSVDEPAELLVLEFLIGGDNSTGLVNPMVRINALGQMDAGLRSLPKPDCKSGCALVAQSVETGTVLAVQRVQ